MNANPFIYPCSPCWMQNLFKIVIILYLHSFSFFFKQLKVKLLQSFEQGVFP